MDKAKQLSFIKSASSYIGLSSHLLSLYFRDLFRRHRRISLAVAGELSGGKSFLLQDMVRSLIGMGITRYSTLKNRSGKVYKSIRGLNPDEKGGTGGTPLYAYRQSRHYGNHVDQMGGFDIDFLNIPGEAFFQEDSDNGRPISSLTAYFNLREKLLDSGSFRVRLYKGPAGILKVVEPLEPTKEYIEKREKPFFWQSQAQEETALNTSYRDCSDFYGFLQTKKYKECKAWRYPRTISGTTLLKNFFDYDTDSVMLALSDFIKSYSDLGFTSTNFDSVYNRTFAFIHYCSQATDLVLCDRVYKPRTEENKNEQEAKFNFLDFCKDLRAFRDKVSTNKKTNYYLAFRNVDFFIENRKENFISLSTALQAVFQGGRKAKERLRNSVYSLFHYALWENLYGVCGIDDKDFMYQIVGDTSDLADEQITKINDAIGERIMIRVNYVDTNGGSGIVHKDVDGLTHIKNCIGSVGSGVGFASLLDDIDDAQILPHIYFTCTPMTFEGEIYTNCSEGNDFEHINKEGQRLLFSLCGSKASFGAYQLCMDILLNHNIGQFEFGGLLGQIQGNKE